MFDTEKLHEECGVFGIYGKRGADVAAQTYLALYEIGRAHV